MKAMFMECLWDY